MTDSDLPQMGTTSTATVLRGQGLRHTHFFPQNAGQCLAPRDLSGWVLNGQIVSQPFWEGADCVPRKLEPFFPLVLRTLCHHLVYHSHRALPQWHRFDPAGLSWPLKKLSLLMRWHSVFVLASCGLVKEPDECYSLIGKCPLRTGTVNGSFPLSLRDGAKYPAGTQKY